MTDMISQKRTYKCKNCSLEYAVYTNEPEKWSDKEPFCPECGKQSEYSVTLNTINYDCPISSLIDDKNLEEHRLAPEISIDLEGDVDKVMEEFDIDHTTAVGLLLSTPTIVDWDMRLIAMKSLLDGGFKDDGSNEYPVRM